jgi:serine/threonine protein kinase
VSYEQTQNNRSSLFFLSLAHPRLIPLLVRFLPSSCLIYTPSLSFITVYLVTDLCQGGELFDRICAKSYFLEDDAAKLVGTVFGAVEYLHSHGIVHRGASPLYFPCSLPNRREDID